MIQLNQSSRVMKKNILNYKHQKWKSFVIMSSPAVLNTIEYVTKRFHCKTTYKDYSGSNSYIYNASAKNRILHSVLSSGINQFLDQPCLLKLRPFLKRRWNLSNKYSFIVDNTVAKDMYEKISANIKENNIVVECNPGLGVLTQFLVESKAPKIHIFEEYTSLRIVSFNKIAQEFSNKIKISPINLFEAKVRQLLVEPFINLDMDLKVVGVTTNCLFFHTLFKLAYHKIKDDVDRMEFYLVVSLNVYNVIVREKMAGGRYYLHCMFKLLFEIEKLAEYPREAFLPLSKENEKKMYLIKIKKRLNHADIVDNEDMKDYVSLIQILGRSKYRFVIPTVEQWIPNCGPYLISKGISMATQTRDLSASDSVILFNFLKNFQGFKDFKQLNNLIDEKE